LGQVRALFEMGGDDDDGDLLPLRVGPDVLEEVPPRGPRHPEIKEDQVREEVADQLARGQTILGADGGVPRVLEHLEPEVAEAGVVVDDQNPLARCRQRHDAPPYEAAPALSTFRDPDMSGPGLALIAETARDLYVRALKVLPPDVKAALADAHARESHPRARDILGTMLKNLDVAEARGTMACH